MRKLAIAVGLAWGFLFLLILVFQTQAAPEVPLGRHCGDVGPLPIDNPAFCGCTWGEVLFHGQPVPGAMVTLTFKGGMVTDVTYLTSLEPVPYFDLTGDKLDARRGDIVSLTVDFAGQRVTRAIRAWPEADGEQHVSLALPERGVWSPWVTGGYTRALAVDRDVVWAGGPAGLISVGLNSGISVVHTLPWSDPLVRALAVGTDGHVWAAGPGGVAEFDGATWQMHTVPLTGTPRALAVNLATGQVWLGGGDTEGSVAVYAGTWVPTGTFNALVTALAVDEAGLVWAGTWEGGAYRQDGNGDWDSHRVEDGLASDYVLAVATGGGAVWFGTKPYQIGPKLHGGIARYDLTADEWQVYTAAHGLPPDAMLPQTPARVYALAWGEDGTVWAGTVDGVRFLADGDWWAAYTTTHGLRAGTVWAIAATDETVIAALPAGLDRLDPDAVPGSPPTAQIVAVTPPTLTLGLTLILTGEAQDGDEANGRIVAWDWSSDRDGTLCTQMTCTLPYGLFTPGDHSIALRAQDDEGIWSAPATAPVVIEQVLQVYLPLVLRHETTTR